MGKKATKAEKKQRVTTVHKMLLSGARRQDIAQYAAKMWDLAESTTDDYIREAKDIILSQLENTQDHELSLALDRLNLLLTETLKTLDYKTALNVVKERNALLGLYAPKHSITEHMGKDGGPIIIQTGMDIDEL